MSISEWFTSWLADSAPAKREDAFLRNIYENWAEGVRRYYSELGWEISEQEMLRKSLRFFFPEYFLFSSPFLLPDFEKAVEILKDAYATRDKRILLYGDRDADGITSTSILYLFLRDVMEYPSDLLTATLPGEEDKYGITEEVAQKIAAQQPDILVALDLGSSNKDAIDSIRSQLSAQGKELKVIILDHHFLPENESDYPNAEAFINPKRLPLNQSERELSTAGLAWHFIQGLTFAFLGEYGQITRLVSSDVTADYCNGVPWTGDEREPDRIIHTDAKDEELCLNALWRDAVRAHAGLAKMDAFLRRHPDALDAGEKLLAIKYISFRSLEQKTRPYLALAAIGTIADLMPIIDNNRILVKQGLGLFRSDWKNLPVGLRELLRALGVRAEFFTEQDLSFSLAPVINAAGRMGVAGKALDTLLEKDPLLAAEKAAELLKINEQRKKLSREGVSFIEGGLNEEHERFPIAIIHDDRVHRGISGLVASRLAELLKKPVLILVNDGESLRGSMRAFQNEDIFSLLKKAESLMIQFGGHRQAAGFSLAYDKLGEFTEFLYKESKHHAFTSGEENNETVSVIHLEERDLVPGLWDRILRFSPYGVLNPHPLVSLSLSQAPEVSLMGGGGEHAKFKLSGVPYRDIEAVWFFHGEEEVRAESGMKLVAEPHRNFFAGRKKLQLKIKYVDV